MKSVFGMILAGALMVGAAGHANAQEGRAMLEFKPYSVTLSVEDIDRAGRWYTDVLGFELVDSKSYPQFGTKLAFFRRGTFRVELIEDQKSQPGPQRADPPAHTTARGVSQFALEVVDIDAAHALLVERGAVFAWELQRYDDLKVAFFFVRDPDGNLVQFIQRLD